MSRTYLHETPAGDKIEFRRVAERIEHLALDSAESDVLRLLE